MEPQDGKMASRGELRFGRNQVLTSLHFHNFISYFQRSAATILRRLSSAISVSVLCDIKDSPVDHFLRHAALASACFAVAVLRIEERACEMQ